MNLKKHFKRRLSSSKRNSLLNPELTNTENVPVFDHVTSPDNTDQPTNSPIVDLTSNTDSNNVETVIKQTKQTIRNNSLLNNDHDSLFVTILICRD